MYFLSPSTLYMVKRYRRARHKERRKSWLRHVERAMLHGPDGLTRDDVGHETTKREYCTRVSLTALHRVAGQPPLLASCCSLIRCPNWSRSPSSPQSHGTNSTTGFTGA